MNIADFTERSNPEDMPKYVAETMGEIGKQEAQKTRNVTRVSSKSLLVVIIALSATGSLGLGILAGLEGSRGTDGLLISSIPMNHPEASAPTLSALSTAASSTGQSLGSIPSGGEVVGDKTTREYYLPWCKQVGKIATADERWFASESEATSSGYVAGEACAGI